MDLFWEGERGMNLIVYREYRVFVAQPRQRFAIHPYLWLAIFAAFTVAVVCGGIMLSD